MEKLDLFVPGRLCVIGEHSDWAGTNRMMNAAIVPGCAIVTGIKQGIYATVEKAETFMVECDLEHVIRERFECKMDTDALRKTASAGDFFSYVAGVASYINEHYHVGGLHVVVTGMDLPIKSGLSSSASICVLVARAFNRLYQLHLNTAGEMNIAYMGEQRTPSRCGRLDQACAFGVKPVRMTFDGNDIRVRPIRLRGEWYWVVADLNAGKNTVKILADLNKCYPFADGEQAEKVHQALGADNQAFVEEAVGYLESGDAESLGRLMVRYQKNFDEKVAQACWSELEAPMLHTILADAGISEYVYGAKGVGSQGDGSVQFLARDKESQRGLIRYLKEKWDLTGVAFTLRPQQKIKKAVIPVAGFGTRLFPATKNLKKAFFPVLDRDGALKPVLLILLEQLEEAGIDEVCLVISERERAIYDEFFTELPDAHYQKLPEDKKQYEDFLRKIRKRVTYVIQKEQKGFGHAVYQCRKFAGDEPVLLLLGDMVYRSFKQENCMTQMIRIYEDYGLPVVSMHPVPKQDVVHYGILHGRWEDAGETVLKLDEIKEKPDVGYAEDYLRVRTKAGSENYYAVFGQYVITKEIFDALKELVETGAGETGEIELTSALEIARKRCGMIGYAVAGKSFDVGLLEKYLETMTMYAR